VGAIRPNDFPRQTNEYGQADSDHASLRTGLDNAEQSDRYLWIRRLGFGSLRARQRLPSSAHSTFRSGLTVGAVWPHIGRISHPRSLVQAVRVEVHLAGIQMPYRSSVVVMLA
jgi:hypothetical protein